MLLLQSSPNIRIACFDDLDMLKEAVASIPESWTIYVFDGRYISFEGDKDWTPEIRDWCRGQSNIKYHKPTDERLPWGVEFDWPLEKRPGVVAKGRWMMYEILPQDEWVLKLDTDERLVEFDVDLSNLDPDTKHYPILRLMDENRVVTTRERMVVPQYWTIWIDDCYVPRDRFPRNDSVDKLKQMYKQTEWRSKRGVRNSDIVIHNYNMSRSSDYLERRRDQLDGMGRRARVKSFEEALEE